MLKDWAAKYFQAKEQGQTYRASMYKEQYDREEPEDRNETRAEAKAASKLEPEVFDDAFAGALKSRDRAHRKRRGSGASSRSRASSKA